MTAHFGKKITAKQACLQQMVAGLHELLVSHPTDCKILSRYFKEIQRHLIAAVKEIKA